MDSGNPPAGAPNGLFPQLRSLHVVDLPHDMGHGSLLWCIGPSLRCFTLPMLAKSVASNAFKRVLMAALEQRSPQLQVLRLQSSLSATVYTELISNFHDLRCLDVPIVDERSLERFSQLRNLEELTFNARLRVFSLANLRTPTLLRKLKGFKVHCMPADFMKLVEFLDLPAIQTVGFKAMGRGATPAERMGAILLALSHRKWGNQLRHVSLDGDGMVDPNWVSPSGVFTQPLGHLQTLTISNGDSPPSSGFHYVPPASFRPQLLELVPSLEYLKLPPWMKMSHQCLLELVSLCPRLRELSMGIQSNTFPQTSPSSSTPTAQPLSQLLVLRISEWTQPDEAAIEPSLIARQIVHLFPLLKEFSAPPSSPWQRVKILVTAQLEAA